MQQKAALFGGMFKKSSKSAEPSVQAQVMLNVKSSFLFDKLIRWYNLAHHEKLSIEY